MALGIIAAAATAVVAADAEAAPAAPAPPRRTLLGERPRPRVLIIGAVSEDVAAAVARLAPTVGTADLGTVPRWAEWDAVVTEAAPFDDRFLRIPTHVYVLGIISAGLEVTEKKIERWSDSDGLMCSVSISFAVRCNEFEPPDPKHGEFATLASQLVARVRQRDHYSYIRSAGPMGLVPVLADAEGRALAGVYRRGAEQSAFAVLVPDDAGNLDRWTQAAFRLWARVDPAVFGGIRDWDAAERWLTARESVAVAALDAHAQKRAEVIQQLDDTQVGLEQDLDRARADARGGHRRLLTAQGAELVTAVENALAGLGFVTVNGDELRVGKSVKLEDLRVSDPDAQGWVALAEVRGYVGGAKVSDLPRIARFAKEYREAEGRWPDRRWYIVNQFLNDSPDGRPRPLAGEEVSVEEFATDDAGAVIDTRTLFRLLRTYEGADPDTLSKARHVLRERLGVWPFDESAAAADPE